MSKAKRSSAHPPPVDPLSELLGYQLRRASSAMMATLAAELAPLGLSVVEASVLLLIAESRGITQSEIGRQLDIHRANVVPIAAKLAAAGLTTAETAGRQSILRLSSRGKRTASAAHAVMRAHDRQYLPELSQRQREHLLQWLRAIWQQCDAELAATPEHAPRAGRRTRS